jgi:hypothetical protein
MIKKSLFVLCIILGLFLIICGSLFAQQNAQELRLGSIITGNLSSNVDIWYRINVTENCLLSIETLGNTDTYLEIYDSRTNLLLENDDGGNGSNARIDMLAANGSSYFIKLRGYGDSSGPFRILADYTPLTNSAELNAGSILSGDLSIGERLLYKVQSVRTGIFTVETSGNMDTLLEAYDSQFRLITSDDDSGEDNNARIELFTEANQIYYVILKGYSSDSSGSYRLLAGFETMSVGNNTSRSTAATLSPGAEVSVFVTEAGQSRWFVCQVTRTGIITFVVQTRGSLDTYLYLYDNNGNLLEEDDDSGDNYNARISTRLSTGTYYIEVKGLGGATGRCTLHAEIR